jgi:hypothetical protein
VAPAGTTLTLGSGDGAVVVPGDVAIRWRNPGPAPTVLVEANVIATEAIPSADGLVITALVEQYNAPLRVPATIELQRVTLPPNATLPPPTAGQTRFVTSATAGQYLRRASDGAYANRNAQPLAAYVLTIVPSANGATPAATPTP